MTAVARPTWKNENRGCPTVESSIDLAAAAARTNVALPELQCSGENVPFN